MNSEARATRLNHSILSAEVMAMTAATAQTVAKRVDQIPHAQG